MLRMVCAASVLLAWSAAAEAEEARAYFAGGCFWCVEADFERVEGVREVISGYTGGTLANPTYEDVLTERTGHYEAVEVIYDSALVSYDRLMFLFFRSVNPTDPGGQFCDRGDSYRTAIFVTNAAERASAEAAAAEAAVALGRAIVTPVLDLGAFWPAEAYHQDYYKGANIVLTRFGPRRQAVAYKLYRDGCGRDARMIELWGNQALFAGK